METKLATKTELKSDEGAIPGEAAFAGGRELSREELCQILPSEPHNVVMRNFDPGAARPTVDEVHEAVLFAEVLKSQPVQPEQHLHVFGPIPLVAEEETEQIKSAGGVAIYVAPEVDFLPHLEFFSNPDKVVVSSDYEKMTSCGDFGLVLDLSRATKPLGISLDKLRSGGGDPQPEPPSSSRISDMLDSINHFEALRFGEWLSREEEDFDIDQLELAPLHEKPVRMLRCHSSAMSPASATPGCIVMRPEVVHDIAELAQNRVLHVGPRDDIWSPKTGLVKEYKERDVWERLAQPGARLAILEQDGKVLGYCLYFLDDDMLPKQGRAIMDALATSGETPQGKCGYANLVEVTPWGRKFAKEHGVSVYQKLLDAMLEDAREAGLDHMLGECRLLPYPNSSAMGKHSEHGWQPTDTLLLSPIGEEGGKVKYFLAQILELKVPSEGVRIYGD